MLFRKNLIYTVLFMATFTLLAGGCQDSVSSLQESPPELPSASSMEIDFSGMDSESAQKTAPGYQSEMGSYSNFTNAAIRVAVMKTIVSTNLAVPKALLTAAENVDPEFNDNGEWTWNYSHSAGGYTFETTLVATQLNSNEIQWQFFVSDSENGIDDRLFFEGTTTDSGQSGNWTYYALFGENAGEPVSEVTWSFEDEENKQIRLDVLSDRNGHLGDYIAYQLEYPVHNAIYYNAENDQATEIEWNSETHEGYLIAPGYNDGEQACWDSQFSNTDCNNLN
jgi:hypothetical protein